MPQREREMRDVRYFSSLPRRCGLDKLGKCWGYEYLDAMIARYGHQYVRRTMVEWIDVRGPLYECLTLVLCYGLV